MCHPASLPSSTPAQRLCKGFAHVLGCPAPLQAASGSAYLLSVSCASRRLSFNMAERLPSALLCSAVSDSLRAATAAFTSITSAAATARGAGPSVCGPSYTGKACRDTSARMQPHSAASAQLAQSCTILQLLPQRRAPVWLAATAAGVMGGRSAESRGIPSSSLVMVQVASGLELLLLLPEPLLLLLLLEDGQMSLPTVPGGRARK